MGNMGLGGNSTGTCHLGSGCGGKAILIHFRFVPNDGEFTANNRYGGDAMDLQELDAIYRLTTEVLVSFDRFPYPARIGERDREAVGKWLDARRLEVLGIHNHLYAVIQAERGKMRDGYRNVTAGNI